MEMVMELIHSPLLYIITVGVFVLLVMSGKLKIHTDKLSISNNGADLERRIIRNQTEYAKTFCKGLIRKFPKDDNKYRKLYIIEMIYNEVMSIISYNHVNTAEDYIHVKQTTMFNIASTTTDEPQYQTDEFKNFIYEKTKELVEELVRIRTLATKNPGK